MATESQAWERLGRDILSDPNNDSLRMRFAALLEEDESKKNHDHARARFIHLQLALARISPSNSQWMQLLLEGKCVPGISIKSCCVDSGLKVNAVPVGRRTVIAKLHERLPGLIRKLRMHFGQIRLLG
jgi:hypothetical protein